MIRLGKYSKCRIIFAFAAIFAMTEGLLPSAQAAFFELPVLDTTMTDPIFQTLASGFVFRPVEPASGLGRIFGVYAGVSLSAVNQTSTGTIFSGAPALLPTTDLQIGIGIPMGISFHIGVLPGLTMNGTSFGRYAGALQWSLSSGVLSALPFALAARFSYTAATLSHTQSITGGSVTLDYGTGLFSGQVLLSKNFVLIEPFLGLGMVNHSSSLTASGTASLFGASFPVGTQSITGSGISAWLQAGLLIKLGFFGIAGEYDNMYGLSSYTIKSSFRF